MHATRTDVLQGVQSSTKVPSHLAKMRNCYAYDLCTHACEIAKQHTRDVTWESLRGEVQVRVVRCALSAAK